MAQLVERSLPFPEVRSSYPDTGTIYFEHLLSIELKLENENEKRLLRMTHFLERD